MQLPKRFTHEELGDEAPSNEGGDGAGDDDDDPKATKEMSRSKLMRLGMLMAVTMTLHNLPEGFAVAFSSYTDVGVVMMLAVAVHNIPEVSVLSHGSHSHIRDC